jgi:hypothetical protein
MVKSGQKLPRNFPTPEAAATAKGSGVCWFCYLVMERKYIHLASLTVAQNAQRRIQPTIQKDDSQYNWNKMVLRALGSHRVNQNNLSLRHVQRVNRTGNIRRYKHYIVAPQSI